MTQQEIYLKESNSYLGKMIEFNRSGNIYLIVKIDGFDLIVEPIFLKDPKSVLKNAKSSIRYPSLYDLQVTTIL